MRPLNALTLVAVCASMLGCEAPTGPTVEAEMPTTPSAAVLSEATAFPFWKRGPLATTDGAYSVMYFYIEDPADIPDDFNLLAFFDFRALGADFNVRAIEVRASAGDPTPKKAHFFALAPIEFWFVPAATFQAAAADGFVGVDELLGTGEVVIGHSSHFGEELHPSGGSAKQVFFHAQARGTLDAGGAFRFSISAHFNEQTGEVNGVSRLRLDMD